MESLSESFAVAGPPGFNAAKDTQDSYQFIYPFGWQEVSVDGQDVVYKDIIEPLESASVSITKTDKSSVTEFGNPLEVSHKPIFTGDLHWSWSFWQCVIDCCPQCLPEFMSDM